MDGILGKEGSNLLNVNTLNDTFNQFMLPLLDRIELKLPDDCFTLYEDLDYTTFIGWQDYRIELIRNILETYGFEKAQKIFTWVPRHNPIVWGHENWGPLFIKNMDDFEKYLETIYDIREQDYNRLKQ